VVPTGERWLYEVKQHDGYHRQSHLVAEKEGHCRLLAVAGRAVEGGASQMTDQAEIARIKNIYAEQEARLATPKRCIPRHWGPGGIAQSGSA
jgi:hypothetical protein